MANISIRNRRRDCVINRGFASICGVRFRVYRSLEMMGLFFGLPFIYTMGLVPFHVLIFLWLAALFAYAFLIRKTDFHFSDLWNFKIPQPHLKRVLLRFLFFSILMTSFVHFFSLGEVFDFPRQHPVQWAKVMLFYPIFSVLPQSFIYRVFFIQRYSDVFTSKGILLVFGALSFMFMHLIFRNWVALALTGVGGFLFLETYLRSKNFLLSAIEHALYGCFAFSVGLGPYLYSGSWDVS